MQAVYEPNLPTILPLLDEVRVVLESPSLLSGETDQQSRTLSFGMRTACKWRIVDVADYLSAIDINVEESPYLDLNDVLNSVRTSYHFFYSYAPCEAIREATGFGNVVEAVKRSAGTGRLIQQMSDIARGKQNAEDCLSHVINTVSQHLHAIGYARAVTASRMFPVTEVLLDAYSVGLYPFGWSDDDDAVLCVRP